MFEAMCTGNWLETTHAQVTDVEYASFQEFIRYFYAGKMQLSERNVHEIVYLLKKYIIDDFVLLIECERFMIDCLTVAGVIKNLTWAILYDLHQLRGKCAQLISGHVVEFIDASIMFLNFEQKLLSVIVKEIPIGVMKTHRERIHDFCIRWAIHHTLASDADPSCIENLRQQLGDVYNLICSTQNDCDEFINRFDVIIHISEASFATNIAIFEPRTKRRRMISLSEKPETHIKFRLVKPFKLLGVRIAPIYQSEPNNNNNIDQCDVKATAYSGIVRLYFENMEIASYSFNRYNDRVIFLNEQNQPGVLLKAGMFYSLQTEITTHRDGQQFEGYVHMSETTWGTVDTSECNWIQSDSSALSAIYLCEA